MFIVQHRKFFFILTVIFILLSVGAIFVYGLKAGTDFTGGTLVEVRYEGERPDAKTLTESLDSAGLSGYSLREAGTNAYILRAGALSNELRGNLAQIFSSGTYKATIDQLTEVGPTVGLELRNKALVALALVLLCILFFIAFAFRKVSEPVSSWIYGLIAIVALVHDVIVPVGFYAVLGHFFGAQVDTLFVTAILTVLGFSIHDTIVVFDRVRENLRLNHEHNKREDFAETAGRSLNQTVVRSINTSLTVLVTLLVLFFIGPDSTRDFALTLLVGIVAGTYSSIFLATPLLVVIERYIAKRK